MIRLATLCGISILLYVLAFACVLDRPLSLGLLRLEIQQKTARLAALESPKLVILAGSNAPYSHSCAVIGAMLGMACENAGVAVGIGLDNLFLRDAPYLHQGDIVYMPMETDQFTRGRAANRASPDAAMLLRHDRAMLRDLPADRTLGAIFCCTLADGLESIAEMPLARAGIMRPSLLLATQFNAAGDRINDPLATADKTLLQMPAPAAPRASAITHGYGAEILAAFIADESARGVTIIGGLPTGFTDTGLSPAAIAAMQTIYITHGAKFIALANDSEYPRADFYDSKDHLAQPCQFKHSIAIGYALAKVLKISANNPSADQQASAATCPK